RVICPRRPSEGWTRSRYCCDRNSTLASQSSSIFSSASAAAMVESGTTQAPARRPPMKVSRYSIELAARIALLSPRPMPMPASVRAMRLMRRSKSRQERALSSHSTARLSGDVAALRAMRIGIETNSGNSSSVGCGTRAVSGLIAGLLLGLDLLDRAACLLPGAEAALDVGDRRQPHVLRRLGRQRRAPGAGAEEDELVAALEIILGVGGRPVETPLAAGARAVGGARHRASAPQLARIADVDEGDARLAVHLHGVGERHRLDLAVGLIDHLLDGLRDLERHRAPSDAYLYFQTATGGRRHRRSISKSSHEKPNCERPSSR